MQEESKADIAIVTPSFARDFELARSLNESVMQYTPFRHYLFVDRSDVPLFRPLASARTVVGPIEDLIPSSFFKVPWLKRHWMSKVSVPVKGWLIQQIVKLSSASAVEEPVMVNMDSDTLFIRDVTPELFRRGGLTRMYRLPGGVTAGMHHVRWHRNICRLLGVPPDDRLPMDDYVGNLISWERKVVLRALERIEQITGQPWHVAYARARRVGEQVVYGLYVDKVIGTEAAGVWIDERSHCHTYWGPEPLAASDVERFVEALSPDDVALSIEGYTGTDAGVARAAIELVKRKVALEKTSGLRR